MNTAFVRALLLALALGSSAAVSSPSVNVNVKAGNIGKGLNVNSLSGDLEVESKVSDDLSVGVNVDNSDSPLKSVFAKFTNKFGSGNVGADFKVALADNAVSGDLKYTEGANEIKAAVNSASDGLVDSIKYTKKGAGWKFAPTFHLKEKNMDLEAEADYSADTNIAVKVASDGAGKLKVKHRVDADTGLTFEGTGSDINAMSIEASRKLDASNTIKPKFDVGSKHVSVGWARKIDGDRTVTVNVNPEKSIGVELEGASDEDWKASVTSPWGDFKDADVSVGRKFNF